MIKFKPIRPRPFNSTAFEKELRVEAQAVGAEVKRDYELTTDTWKTKPKFVLTVKASLTGGVMIVVETFDKIYRFVSEGTRPHIIRARNAVALRFQSGYKAKTRKGLLGSVNGGPRGETLYARIVHHPGTEARDFDKLIAKRWKPNLKRRFQQAMSRAAGASGHALR